MPKDDAGHKGSTGKSANVGFFMYRRLFMLSLPASFAMHVTAAPTSPVCPYCRRGDCIGYDEDEICDQALEESIEVFPTDRIL